MFETMTPKGRAFSVKQLPSGKWQARYGNTTVVASSKVEATSRLRDLLDKRDPAELLGLQTR